MVTVSQFRVSGSENRGLFGGVVFPCCEFVFFAVPRPGKIRPMRRGLGAWDVRWPIAGLAWCTEGVASG